MVFYHDDSTPWPWPAISYIDGFLMSALSSMLELVVSVECSCSCSIVMEFLNIWCVYCFIWWNKEESQKTVYFILILFLSLFIINLLRARYIHIHSAIRIRYLQCLYCLHLITFPEKIIKQKVPKTSSPILNATPSVHKIEDSENL